MPSQVDILESNAKTSFQLNNGRHRNKQDQIKEQEQARNKTAAEAELVANRRSQISEQAINQPQQDSED